MNASKLIAALAALGLMIGFSATGYAGSPRASSDLQGAGVEYVDVLITGSNIPQTVRIKAIGTTTTSPVRVFDRHEIDQTGAFNTEDVLRHDPSITVHGFGQAGPNN
jgi:outer membrane cobalamin receptor